MPLKQRSAVSELKSHLAEEMLKKGRDLGLIPESLPDSKKDFKLPPWRENIEPSRDAFDRGMYDTYFTNPEPAGLIAEFESRQLASMPPISTTSWNQPVNTQIAVNKTTFVAQEKIDVSLLKDRRLDVHKHLRESLVRRLAEEISEYLEKEDLIEYSVDKQHNPQHARHEERHTIRIDAAFWKRSTP